MLSAGAPGGVLARLIVPLDIRMVGTVLTATSEQSSTTVGQGYRPQLDGLRAVAVYLVVVFHAGADRFSGGFIGVDVFFVLSGYLVTQLLMRDLTSAGRIRFGRFYARRMRRLLPASVVALVVTALVYSALASRTEVVSAENAFKAAFLYVTNWFFIHRAAGYFAASTDTNPVLHFWSLAVEEQFYFIWPILLAGLFAATRPFRHNARRAMQIVVAVGAVASALWALHLAGSSFNHAYYGTDARAYELLAGALLALTPGVVVRARRSRLPDLVAPLALLAVLALATSAAHMSEIHRGIAITITSVVLIVAIESGRSNPATFVLSSGPLVYLGQISYGTYLWHWPVIVMTREILPSISPIATAGSASLLATGLASLSFQLVEKPVRTFTSLDRLGPVVIGAGLGIAVLAALVVIPQIVVPTAHTTSAAASSTIGSSSGGTPTAGLNLAAASRLPVDVAKLSYPPGWTCKDEAVAGCTLIKNPHGENVLVIGDSHSRMMWPTFIQIARQQHLTLSVDATGGCPWQHDLYDATPVPTDPNRVLNCRTYKEDLYGRVLPTLKPDLVIALDNDYLVRRPATLYDADNHPVPSANTAQLLKQYDENTSASLSQIERYAKKVLIVEPVPTAPVTSDPFVCLGKAKYVEDCRFNSPRGPTQLETMYRTHSDGRRVFVASFDNLLCPALPVCDAAIHGVIVRFDIQHITPAFAETLTVPVTKILENAGLIHK